VRENPIHGKINVTVLSYESTLELQGQSLVCTGPLNVLKNKLPRREATEGSFTAMIFEATLAFQEDMTTGDPYLMKNDWRQ
jgi:hypothetical protein